MALDISPKHQRLLLVVVLSLIVLFQWTRSSASYPTGSNFITYAPPVTPADVEQGITRKPRDNGQRVRGAFVMVCRDSELYDLVETVRSVEERFNSRYHYDWVFISDGALPSSFRDITRNLASGETKYGYAPRSEWSFPHFIDAESSHNARVKMAYDGVPDAMEIKPRHKERFLSGFLMNHTILQDYDYFWRIDPGVTIKCDINYDVFKFMKQNDKKYAFGAALRGDDRTDPTLFEKTSLYFESHPDQTPEGNNAKFIDLDAKLDPSSSAHCEFYTGFEIGDLSFFRSKEYTDFFDHLDMAGGFYSEKWSVNQVRTVATSMLLPVKQMHWFSDIGYNTEKFSICPMEKEIRLANKCTCNPRKSASWNPRKFCMHKYFIVNQLERPDGWRDAMNRDV